VSDIEADRSKSPLEKLLNRLAEDVKRDELISKSINRFPKRIQPRFLELLGSRQLQAKFFQTAFQKQVERGKISQDEAETHRQTIIKGDAAWFVQDMLVGAISSNAIEKPLMLVIGVALARAGNPELAVAVTGYIWGANVIAVPYFIPRAIQEFKYRKTQLDQSEESRWRKGTKLGLSAAELSTSVLLNLVPGPFSLLPTPLLTRHRNKGISGVIGGYHFDNFRDLVGRVRHKPSQNDGLSN
jgi:hypothetical protein